jgi:hypothetical protein
MVFI